MQLCKEDSKENREKRKKKKRTHAARIIAPALNQNADRVNVVVEQHFWMTDTEHIPRLGGRCLSV